jgi:hypothetical protein
MGRRLKLQSEYIVRVSTAGEPGVRGYSFLARLRISQPKEMAIEESMHLQEREVIRGGWCSCRYTSNIETDRSPYVCERSFHVPGYRFSYDQDNSPKSHPIQHIGSKSSGSPWHLDSSKLKYRSEKNQYHILKSRARRLSVEGEASDAGQGSRIRSASPNKMHSRCGVRPICGVERAPL